MGKGGGAGERVVRVSGGVWLLRTGLSFWVI